MHYFCKKSTNGLTLEANRSNTGGFFRKIRCTHLFVKYVPRPGDSEVTFSSSSQAAFCYYQSNHSKAETIR